MTEWTLTYDGYDPDEEGLREALCTLGNGVMATRGAAPESRADGVHYPATYLAGLFNRLTDDVEGVEVTNESIVNLPNWLVLTVRIGDGPWLDLDGSDWRVDRHRLRLDMRRGVLTRHLTATDTSDRTVELTQRRIVHLDDPQVAALETTIVARGFSGELTVRSVIDTGVRNQGVARYADLSDQHLDVLDASVVDDTTVVLTTETNQSHVRVAHATRTRVWHPDDDTEVDARRDVVDGDDLIGHDLLLEVEDGRAITVVKSAVIVSGRDPAVSESTENAVRKVLPRATSSGTSCSSSR